MGTIPHALGLRYREELPCPRDAHPEPDLQESRQWAVSPRQWSTSPPNRLGWIEACCGLRLATFGSRQTGLRRGLVAIRQHGARPLEPVPRPKKFAGQNRQPQRKDPEGRAGQHEHGDTHQHHFVDDAQNHPRFCQNDFGRPIVHCSGNHGDYHRVVAKETISCEFKRGRVP